ncbi:MAG: DUF4267 domain-containing protein [Chloroflexi bacterium]|nr:DUF4267 domain-containing protein [Chloroflexota bacterium]
MKRDLGQILRLSLQGLGVGTSLFGLTPLLAPDKFAQLFGLPYDRRRPAAAMAVRSVGARDLISGLAVVATAGNISRNRPWLLVRLAADGGDAVITWAALRGEPRNRRLLALGIAAAGAALVDVTLLLLSVIAKKPGS